jgi:serine phosphatase RsbU (regulator of sigma subunit)
LIVSDGRALGALQIDTLNQRHRFQPADLEVLASVAAQAAIAIDNAQLHERAIQPRAMEKELELAQQVKQSFLPQSRPEPAGYRFYDFYQPANQIGGDFFDYVLLPDGRIAILIADVVGHGVAAALLMAKLSSESRFCLAIEHEPGKVMARLNAKLCEDTLDDRFVTLVMAVLHPTSHELVVVNAGHMAPILCTGDGDVLEIGSEQSGLPLGIVPDIAYEQYAMKLALGQTFAMFTDGLTEAANENGELYGLERLRQQAATGLSSPRALVKRLVEDVQQFVGPRAPGDDMCIVSFGRAEPASADADSSLRGELVGEA